jgi:lipopolysaccharide/colanic/teichoic acid biosynthesis glycosyltransferase
MNSGAGQYYGTDGMPAWDGGPDQGAGMLPSPTGPVSPPTAPPDGFALAPAPLALWGPGFPAAQIRPVPRRTISLAGQRLAAGQAIIGPAGNTGRGYRLIKRAMDVAGAVLMLVLLAPVMLAVFLILLATTRGRPIFAQTRLGHCGRPFTMYKFRTMVRDAGARRAEVPNEQDGPIFKNRRDPRVTRLGRLLRRTSIDETPQLFNVLLGQMSLVGPRPPIGDEVACYRAWQRPRLAVKPGLTCLWQVSGRSEIGFEDWVRMDLWYLRHQGLWTDLVLLLRTPQSVLSRRGAY